MRFSGALLSKLILAEGDNTLVPSRVQYLRVGKFKHPKYGDFEITPEILLQLKDSFDKRVRGIDTSFDYGHESDKEASGWVTGFQLDDNGTSLFADVAWTPQAQEKIRSKEFRYFSPDFAKVWQNPETGIVHNNVVFGGGLTNRPFIKEMDAIIASEEKEMKELEEMKAANLKLSEQLADAEKKVAAMEPVATDAAAKIAALEADIKAKMDELAKLKGEGEAMMKENVAMKDQIACTEKETAFSKLLSEGKAVPAQKAAFIKGDLTEFVKLSEKPNLEAKGHGTGGESGTREEQVLKLAETLRSKDAKLTVGESISMAIGQLK